VSTLLKFSYVGRSSYFLFYVIKNIYFNYDGCEEIFLVFFKCMKCVVPGHLLGTFSKWKTKKNSFYFSCNLYISLSTTTDFYKVPYSENLQS
jgi:hypothetical protein